MGSFSRLYSTRNASSFPLRDCSRSSNSDWLSGLSVIFCLVFKIGRVSLQSVFARSRQMVPLNSVFLVRYLDPGCNRDNQSGSPAGSLDEPPRQPHFSHIKLLKQPCLRWLQVNAEKK